MRYVKCIVNPAAGRGGARKVWPKIAATLKSAGVKYSVDFSQGPGHATVLTRQALKSEFQDIIAVGGDGTINEVVNGFFEHDRPVRQDARLGIIPRGTGIDLIRTLPVPANPQHAVEVILRGHTRRFDVGKLTCLSRDGKPQVRYFMNVADLGYGGALVDRVNGFTKLMGSFLSYFVGLLYTLTFYQNEHIRFQIDDEPEEEGVFSAIIAANGRYFGGGMHIAPEARADDGLLEFVLIGDVSKLEVLGNLVRLYRGTLHKHPKVVYRRGKRLRAWSDREVLLDADGELPGKLPATFEILPAAVHVFSEK